jgi:hypothetical protein
MAAASIRPIGRTAGPAWTGGPGAAYHGRVQQVLLFAGILGVLAALALVTARWTWGTATITGRIALGVIPGIAGALIIGVWQTDLIPDAIETALLPVLLGVCSFAMGLLVLLHLQAR